MYVPYTVTVTQLRAALLMIHSCVDMYVICRSGEEIAVVYYRAGYSPNDYPSDKVYCMHIHV